MVFGTLGVGFRLATTSVTGAGLVSGLDSCSGLFSLSEIGELAALMASLELTRGDMWALIECERDDRILKDCCAKEQVTYRPRRCCGREKVLHKTDDCIE